MLEFCTPRRAIPDHKDPEPLIATWTVRGFVPPAWRFDRSTPAPAEAVLKRHAQMLTRQAGRRGFVAQAQTALASARPVAQVLVVGPGGLDPLAERRTTLLQRLTLGRAAREAFLEGKKIADMAAEARCTDTWIRNLMLLAGLPEEIQAEIRRPRSLAAALSDRQLREVARRRKDPAAARALFEALLGQVRAFVDNRTLPARPQPQQTSRRGLRPVFDQARAWAELLEMGEARSARELAKKLNLSNVTICTYLDLLKLVPELRAALDLSRPLPVPVPIKHLQTIARLPPGEQVAAFEDRWPGLLGRRSARSA